MQRQAVRSAVILTVGVTLMGLASTPKNRLAEVQKGVRQLFLNDEIIEHMDGLRRVVHQPQKHPANPVIEGTNPWERAAVSVYGTALYDEAMKRFRIWYLCIPGPPPLGRKWVEVGGYRRVANCTLVAYAVSEDGVHWDKPVLNQLSFEGSKANNLIDIGIDNPEGISVLHDPHDPNLNRRYKAFFWDRRVSPPDDPIGVDEEAAKVPKELSGLTKEQLSGGMWVAFSPDGIRWRTHGPVLPIHSDTTQAVVYDPRWQKFVAFGRFGFGRKVARTESADFLHWSQPQLVLEADERDGPAAQIYGMPTDLYEGLYLGMLWLYHEGTTGKIDTQLAVSRDGIRWQRVGERQTFLPNGPEGARDDGMARAVGRYIVRGDTIYLYYSMVNGPHRGPKFPNPVRKFPSAIGLATLRRDGFVSLDAGDQEGYMLTKPFVMPEGDLHVNADAKGGTVTVAICDETGTSFNGFEASQAIATDAPRAVIRWEGVSLRSLWGKVIRLRFTLWRANLFSFWFE